MSVLDDVLHEEYDRLLRMRSVMQKERDGLPNGYLSEKKINGKPYFYIQQRCGKKIVGTYVQEGKVADVKKQVTRRKQLDASLKEIEDNIRKIERVIK